MTSSPWPLLASYFDTKGYSFAQIDCFNDFLGRGVEQIFRENDICVGGFHIRFGAVYIPFPSIRNEDEQRHLKPLFPNEARMLDLTYDAPICVDIYDMVTGQQHYRVPFCRIPIMLGSARCHLSTIGDEERVRRGECSNDPKGYFIIRGKERVLIGQVRNAYNIALVKKQEDDRWEYVCTMRSMSETTNHSILVEVKMGVDKRIHLFLGGSAAVGIPVALIFQVLLSTSTWISAIRLSDNDIPGGWGEYVAAITDESLPTTKDATYAVHDLLKHTFNITSVAETSQVLENELFPHMGVCSTLSEKGLCLGSMIRKLIMCHAGLRFPDDIDNYAHKRVELSGALCHELLRTCVKNFVKQVSAEIRRKPRGSMDILTYINRYAILKITDQIRTCFGTGNWGLPKNNYIRKGVSAILSRACYAATLSHLHRISLPLNKESSNFKPRQVDTSHYMFIDPLESPEGKGVGLILNLAWLTCVSHRLEAADVRNLIEDGIPPSPLFYMGRHIKFATETPSSVVLVNGAVIGLSDQPCELLTILKKWRDNSHLLHPHVSITYNALDHELRLWCDGGRLIRPVFNMGVLNMGMGVDVWDEGVASGVIQYVDHSQCEASVVAPDINEYNRYLDMGLVCEYMEICDVNLFGMIAQITPFSDHIPSARNIFQTNMSKQAIGTIAFNPRFDTSMYTLNYPQKSIVATVGSHLLNFDEMPYGINAIVAIGCYTGFSQEDAVIVNQSAVDRGLFTALASKTIVEQERRTPSAAMREIFGMPEAAARKRGCNYSFLDSMGIVELHTRVKKGDVIVGKYLTCTRVAGLPPKIIDKSYVVKKDEEGYIERVALMTTPSGNRLVKIVISKLRSLELGDKMASGGAQKGTIGLLLPQVDMPFTRDGITPDILINTHCIPSRMTINVLMEIVLAKACALSGYSFGDATPFTSANTIDTIAEALGKCGFEKYGSEEVYCGFTGIPLRATMMIGPQYYLNLKHLVSEKIHARASGFVNAIFHQACSGRKNDGGLRVGEMEKDAIAALGMSSFLVDRLHEQSDPFEIFVCLDCQGRAAIPTECLLCGGDNIRTVKMPFVANQYDHYLTAMGIKTKFNLNQRGIEPA